MAYYLCDYHNNDDALNLLRRNTKPWITCQACRAQGYFTEEQIEKYKANRYKRYAVYKRGIGYPDTLYVILDEQDSLFEAERVAPHNEFQLMGIEHNDPSAYASNNTRVMNKPGGGQTLEDSRSTWDHAPWYDRTKKSEPLIHAPQAYVVEITPAILRSLSLDYEETYRFNPEEFELLVQDRLEVMGFETQRVRGTYSRDGGVDIIFWPRPPFPMPFLAAAQVKHHRLANKKTGPATVRELAALIGKTFQFGLIVTNTTFTPDAMWFAKQRGALLRLRDMMDLRRWIAGEFLHESEWREIPRRIHLCPGVEVDLQVGSAVLPEKL